MPFYWAVVAVILGELGCDSLLALERAGRGGFQWVILESKRVDCGKRCPEAWPMVWRAGHLTRYGLHHGCNAPRAQQLEERRLEADSVETPFDWHAGHGAVSATRVVV